MAWYTVAPASAFQIVGLHRGAEYMLHLLLEKDLPLAGSFTITEVEDSYPARKIDHEGLGHVAGKIRINWFRYANAFIKGTAN